MSNTEVMEKAGELYKGKWTIEVLAMDVDRVIEKHGITLIDLHEIIALLEWKQ